MSQRLHRVKFGLKRAVIDAKRDAAFVKQVKLGIDPTRLARTGKMYKLPSDLQIESLVEELKKNIGTPAGTDLRGQIVSVITAARKEVAIKARGAMRRGGLHGGAAKSFKGKW